MKVFTTRNFLSAKHWAFVDIDVSNYDFWEKNNVHATYTNDKQTGN
jgi:hypothetical protein